MKVVNKAGLAAVLVLLVGCAGTGGSVPVVDSGRTVSNEDMRSGAGLVIPPQPSEPRDAGVVVLIPDEAGGSQPIQSFPVDVQGGSGAGVTSRPAGGNALNQDEQLDGPVLALLTSAREQEGRGDLGSASSSLERAMRIAPREPQVFYRLAEVRLAQGDAAQAEQIAQRGLSHAAGQPSLQAGLWDIVARAREQQGNAAGAADARQRARVSM
ncbi:MAG: tetratricopeptide repeat protein [Pseudomonas sp.]